MSGCLHLLDHRTSLQRKGGGGGRGGQTVEGAFVCDIIDQKDTHGAAVVSSGDGPEAFLTYCPQREKDNPRDRPTMGLPTSCIPNLKLHPLAIQVDSSDFEIDSDCRDEAWCEAVFAKAQ